MSDPTCDGDQLLVVVPRWIRVPVPHQEAQFCMVEQVQLCDKCSDGWRDNDFGAFYIFHIAGSQGGDYGGLVGEQCV